MATTAPNKLTKEEEPEHKRTIHRSPSYPMFSLEDAVGKIKVLWDKDGKAGAPAEVMLTHLGYKKPDGPPSGPAARTLAALKKYGLTNEQNNRIVLSQRGLNIVIYPPTDERHIKALKDAALEPSLYAKLYDTYRDGLPSEETLRAELVGEHGFNPRQVDGFLSDFKRTLEYAGISFGTISEEKDKSESMNLTSAEKQQKEKLDQLLRDHKAQHPVMKSYPIPLKNQNEATLAFKSFPVEKSDLAKIKQWIDLMEENLTEKPNDPFEE